MNKKSRQHIESALQHTCPEKQLSHVQRALELMSFGGSLGAPPSIKKSQRPSSLFLQTPPGPSPRTWASPHHPKPSELSIPYLTKIYEKHLKGSVFLGSNAGSFNVIWFFGNKVLRVSVDGMREGGELTEKVVNDSIKNWVQASEMRLVPNIEWMGLVQLGDLDDLPAHIFHYLHQHEQFDTKEPFNTPHVAMVMDAYEQNFYTFITEQMRTGRWRSIKDATEQILKKTWQLTVDLGVGCIDTKPQNIVVNTKPVLDVRLIDLEVDNCKHATGGKNLTIKRSYRKGAFILSICFLALHSLQLFGVNLFLPFLQKVLENQEVHIPEVPLTKTEIGQVHKFLQKNRQKGRAFGMNDGECPQATDDQMFTGITTLSIKTAWNLLGAKFTAEWYFSLDTFEDFFFMSTHQSPYPPVDIPACYTNFENTNLDRTLTLMDKVTKVRKA